MGVLLDHLVAPLATWVGEAWHNGSIRILHEHGATTTILGFLTRLRQAQAVQHGAPLLIMATPAGELHEVGAALAATTALLSGWRCTYFGPNLPAPEIAQAAGAGQAAAVGLSIAAPGDNTLILQQIEDSRQYLPKEMLLLVGGAGANRHVVRFQELGIVPVLSLQALHNQLASLRT